MEMALLLLMNSKFFTKKNQIHLTQGKIQFLMPGIFNDFFSRDAFEFVLKNADDVKGVSKGMVFLEICTYACFPTQINSR